MEVMSNFHQHPAGTLQRPGRLADAALVDASENGAAHGLQTAARASHALALHKFVW
jgi:hypothetical protein